VRGALTTTNGRPPLQQWLRDLHGNLRLGTPGRLYSEVVASWLPVLIIGGLILWIGRRRKRKVRDLALPERGVKPASARIKATLDPSTRKCLSRKGNWCPPKPQNPQTGKHPAGEEHPVARPVVRHRRRSVVDLLAGGVVLAQTA
jgi:hypothetical protein